ncbi:RnfABCDGE type electron transport complex subunit D [Spirochaeta lutea]|uniref:RnfABCDGE type electron transport complex subunit D n=1 Tax=Spirochaeta lutea TaxID=1480694 RepID=A0A098QSM4_9SPIO|nr:RnfABCDGE type electron transport complex subunit D [Spirochaeta lutea]KGE70749.1 hypothetical protein DC28_14715 [Spirochaeta lutea]
MGDIRQSFFTSPQINGTLAKSGLFLTRLLVAGLLSTWGLVLFGLQALWVLGAAVLGYTGSEVVLARLRRGSPSRIAWMESLSGGLLLGLLFSPGIHPLIPLAAGVFAQVIIRWGFGGSTGMWMSPQLGGQAIAMIAWPLAFSQWTFPGGTILGSSGGVDAVTGGTTLSYLRQVGLSGTISRSPLQAMTASGETHGVDASVTEWLNRGLLNDLGINLPEGYAGRFLGFQGGAMGEISILLILVCSILLISRRAVYGRVSAWYLLTFGLGMFVFGGLESTGRLFTGDVLFHLINGGVLFIGFIFLPDLTSAPQTRLGQVIYAVVAAGLTLVFRLFGSPGVGAGFAALVAMILVPMLDIYVVPRVFGVQTRRMV